MQWCFSLIIVVMTIVIIISTTLKIAAVKVWRYIRNEAVTRFSRVFQIWCWHCDAIIVSGDWPTRRNCSFTGYALLNLLMQSRIGPAKARSLWIESSWFIAFIPCFIQAFIFCQWKTQANSWLSCWDISCLPRLQPKGRWRSSNLWMDALSSRPERYMQ